MLSVQQSYGIDKYGGVCGILAIGKLLDRLDSLLEELIIPPVQAGAGLVAICPFYAYGPISSNFRE